MTGYLALAWAVLAVSAPALALLPPEGTVAPLGLGWLTACIAVLITAYGTRTGDVGSWVRRTGPLLYLASVALLRHAEGGSSSGFSPLLLLPLFWVALTEDRIELGLLLVGIAAMFAVPTLVYGDPAYPQTEWRRLTIWLVAAPIVGVAAQSLVARARRANESLTELARTDPLTGLVNRRGFEEIVGRELLRARRTGEPLVIAFADLDHFKRFNDTHGHAAGDRLLCRAALGWREELRDIDVLARWGGEEFVILLPRCPEPFAHNVLDRLRNRTPEEQTCSIGFASWHPPEQLADTIARADAALYAAKEGGRNRVVAAAAG